MEQYHYSDVIMTGSVSQITSLTIVYSTVYSSPDQKKTSKLRVTGLCVGNSTGTSEFPSQRASNAENVSIWWRHHAQLKSRIQSIQVIPFTLYNPSQQLDGFKTKLANTTREWSSSTHLAQLINKEASKRCIIGEPTSNMENVFMSGFYYGTKAVLIIWSKSQFGARQSQIEIKLLAKSYHLT